MHLTIYCDGGSKGNPGYGYGSYEILREQPVSMFPLTKCHEIPLGDNLTNNQAEYMILIEALKRASNYKAQSVEVFTDSLLVVNQMKGLWRCKNQKLIQLRDEARALMDLVRAKIYWNSRTVSVEKFGH